jgi:benzoate-CoA ligase family protein
MADPRSAVSCRSTRDDASPSNRVFGRDAHTTVTATPGAGPILNAASYFIDRHIGEGRGGSVAIECGDRRVTYSELQDQVNRIGCALRDAFDVRPEERVLLLTLDGPEMVAAFFGAIKIGAVPVPLNTRWTPADYEFVLRDSGARVVIVSSDLYAGFADAIRGSRGDRHVVVVGDEVAGDRVVGFDALVASASPILDAEATSRDAPAFWLYSSGSTGHPKGCVHLQHDMCVCADSYARGVLSLHEGDRTFSVAKLFFAYGLGNSMYFPLAVGATAVLWPGIVTPSVVYEVVERYRPTLFFSVPTHYAMMLAHTSPDREFDLSSIRHAVSAGEALPPAIFERFRDRFGIEILDGIGSTEVLHIFISNQPGRIRPGSSGVLVDGYDARIVDEDGRPVARGELGDLIVRGDSTCAFYWNRHEQTKDTIAGHWIRTGDKYWQDEDGYFWFAGRSDDMLKVGGIWVSPAEVEHLLLEHPAVHACGITGREDRDGLIKPVAHVVLRAEIAAGPDLVVELQQFARQRLAEYKRPRWIEFVDALPVTATGKIQRFKLRARRSAAEE